MVADQRFPVGLTRLIRATLQPEAAFIEAHYSNMGYWAIVIEPWALDAGASHFGPLPRARLLGRASCGHLLDAPHSAALGVASQRLSVLQDSAQKPA